MDKPAQSLEAGFFEKMYRENEDPWNFETSPYERAKYEATLNTIPNTRYAHIFEIGCSNGLLSTMLADRCQKLLAVDASTIAAENARRRLATFPHVKVEVMVIPAGFPGDLFDLILLSEVGYFLIREDLIVARDKMIDALLPGGHLLLVHWTPDVQEFPLTGDQVHEIFLDSAGVEASNPLIHLHGTNENQYRLDLFEKKQVEPSSVW